MRAKPLLKVFLLGTSAFFVAYPVLAQPQDASHQTGDPLPAAPRPLTPGRKTTLGTRVIPPILPSPPIPGKPIPL